MTLKNSHINFYFHQRAFSVYLKQLKAGEKFDEMPAEKVFQVYQYKRVAESYTGKKRKSIECARTTSIDHNEPVQKLVK